ncbi:MAG: BrnA antitoxin family protein [Bdellovibrionota bacterium]
MRDEYDFSKGKRGAYNSRVKKQITIKLDEPTIEYFRKLADETGITYQNLINLYLRECAVDKKRPAIKWQKTGS